EAQVTLDQLLKGVLVAGADLFREIDLLRPLEQGIGGYLVEVLIENIALRFIRSDPSGGRAAATTLEFGHVTVVSLAHRARWSRASISGGMRTCPQAASLRMKVRTRRLEARTPVANQNQNNASRVRERRCKIPASQIFASPFSLTLTIPRAILRGSCR